MKEINCSQSGTNKLEYGVFDECIVQAGYATSCVDQLTPEQATADENRIVKGDGFILYGPVGNRSHTYYRNPESQCPNIAAEASFCRYLLMYNELPVAAMWANSHPRHLRNRDGVVQPDAGTGISSETTTGTVDISPRDVDEGTAITGHSPIHLTSNRELPMFQIG